MTTVIKHQCSTTDKESIAETDRRSRPRVQSTLSVQTSEDANARLVNISETGACFLTSQGVLTKDFILKIGFTSQLVDVPAKIEWTKATGTNGGVLQGVSFQNLGKAVVAVIQKHVVLESFKPIASDAKSDQAEKYILGFSEKLQSYLHALVELEKLLAAKKIDAEILQNKLTSLSNDIVASGDELKEQLDNKLIFNRIKKLFRDLVGPWAFKSQIMKRGFDKPKGYPGDYRTLEVIYDFETFSPETDLGFYFDRYFLQNPYADAVRNRKDVLREMLHEALLQRQGPVKVLNLASGSCREMRELFDLHDAGLLKKDILFSCIDWDEDTLSFSKSALSALPRNIKVDFIKENILNFAKTADFFKQNGLYDVTYSIGLADYLPDRVLKNVIKNSFGGLNPGGEFIIAHKDREITFSHLPPEWFCDWVFIPRNEKEMLDIVNQVRLGKFISKIMRDKTDQIFFISLLKE